MWANKRIRHGKPDVQVRETSPNRNEEDESRQYQYAPIVHLTGAFRLLSLLPGTSDDPIKCTMSVVRGKSSNNDYAALSYVWGDQTYQRAIAVDNKMMTIGTNLHSFLVHLRHPVRHLKFWTDAICINQNDKTEKGHQVQMMGDIYRNAKNVFAWLGEDTHKITSLLNVFSRSTSTSFVAFHQTRDMQHFSGIEETEAMASLSNLCRCKYWTRAWIVQELLLARSLIFLVGETRIPQKDLSALIEFGCRKWPNFADTSHIHNLITEMKIPRQKRFRSMEQLLERFGRQECLDRRDRIYSLISLAKWDTFIVTDYKVNRIDLYLRLRFDFSDPRILQRVLDIPDSELELLGHSLPDSELDLLGHSLQQLLPRHTELEAPLLYGGEYAFGGNDWEQDRTQTQVHVDSGQNYSIRLPNSSKLNSNGETSQPIPGCDEWKKVPTRNGRTFYYLQIGENMIGTYHSSSMNSMSMVGKFFRKRAQSVYESLDDSLKNKLDSTRSSFVLITSSERTWYDTVFMTTPKHDKYRVTLPEAMDYLAGGSTSSAADLYLPILQAADVDQDYKYTPLEYANALHMMRYNNLQIPSPMPNQVQAYVQGALRNVVNI